jgi:hypothetical protein
VPPMNDPVSATERPWRVEPDADGYFFVMRVNDPNPDAHVCVYGRADADLIVRSVNAHDELVAALRATVAHYHITHDAYTVGAISKCPNTICREAIALLSRISQPTEEGKGK